jgi:hypothetical protein
MRAPPTAEAELDGLLAPVGDAEARAIVAHATRRYIAARHARVEGFVDRHFSLIGSLRLHRQAPGLDLVRAPANVLLMLPYLTMQLCGAGLRSPRGRARGALAWRPYAVPRHRCRRRARLAPPLRAAGAALRRRAPLRAWRARRGDPGRPRCRRRGRSTGRQAHDPEQQARLHRLLDAYASTRAAAADLVNNVLLASTGMATFHKLTPGTLTLGPVIATALAQQAAVASFPLGSALGGLWYGMFPVAPSASPVAGATGGLVLLTATTAAFAGVIADPVQRALGLHQHRLHRLIDALGRELEGDSDAAFHARDHYVARIFGLIDLARATYRAI